MKAILMTGLLFVGVISHAQTRSLKEVPISKINHLLYVEVSPQTVKLSRAGYDRDLVKILIPQLAELTLLNHRNEGESAPCLATWTLKSADEVHGGKTEVQTLDVQIELTKVLVGDLKTGVCKVSLKEEIETIIAGEKFYHVRQHELQDRHIDDCQ